jgi:hypothetical protein
LSRTGSSILRSPDLAAFTAALWLIGKAFLSEKPLLSLGEDELSSTIFTRKNSIFQRSTPL